MTDSAAHKTPTRSGRPKKAEAKLKLEQLLNCASALFAEQGYAATSMDAISAHSQMSKPAIYARFGSKAGLLTAVIDHILALHLQAVPAAVHSSAESAVSEQLARILRASLEPAFLRLFRLFLAEASRVPEIQQAFVSASDTSIAVLQTAINTSLSADELAVPARDVAATMLDLVNRPVMMCALGVNDAAELDVDIEAKRITSAVLYGALRRPSA